MYTQYSKLIKRNIKIKLITNIKNNYNTECLIKLIKEGKKRRKIQLIYVLEIYLN